MYFPTFPLMTSHILFSIFYSLSYCKTGTLSSLCQLLESNSVVTSFIGVFICLATTPFSSTNRVSFFFLLFCRSCSSRSHSPHPRANLPSSQYFSRPHSSRDDLESESDSIESIYKQLSAPNVSQMIRVPRNKKIRVSSLSEEILFSTP